MIFAIIITGILSGLASIMLRVNVAEGRPATLTDWAISLLTAIVSAVSVLMLIDTPFWLGAPVGSLLAILGIRPLTRAWACPVSPPLTGALPVRIYWVALGLIAVGIVAGISLPAAYVAVSALIAATAWTTVRHGEVQWARIRSVSAPLSAALGCSEERLMDNGIRVDESGVIFINRPAANAVARFADGRLTTVVATAMPAYEVDRASTSSRIIIRPVSAETAVEREHMADSGGLVQGIETRAHSGAIEMEQW